jgi:isoquinoline 1-oxidoreductase
VESDVIQIDRLCVAYECGAITSPANLLQQVRGGIIQALGPALFEAVEFENGRIINASLRDYRVPRMADVPPIDVHLLNRPDLPSAGAGETPQIAAAPAIANAVFDATGKRLRRLPLRLGSA